MEKQNADKHCANSSNAGPYGIDYANGKGLCYFGASEAIGKADFTKACNSQ